ncbi:MAG: hypothetical protein AB8G99_03395 [Planctomycetaceae bacterium]
MNVAKGLNMWMPRGREDGRNATRRRDDFWHLYFRACLRHGKQKRQTRLALAAFGDVFTMASVALLKHAQLIGCSWLPGEHASSGDFLNFHVKNRRGGREYHANSVLIVF